MTKVVLENTNIIQDLDLTGGLSILTIYERPFDFPEQYVVRESTALDGCVYMHVDYQLAETLEEARRLIPPGRVCLAEPNTKELPAVESWI
jgi:hypothetical protein